MDKAYLYTTMQLRAPTQLRLFMLLPLLRAVTQTTRCNHQPRRTTLSLISPYTAGIGLAVQRRKRPCRTTQETRVAVPLNSKLGVVDFRRRCCRSHVSEIVSLGNLIVHLCCPRRTPTKSFTSSGPKGFEPMSETLSFVSMPRTLIDPSISHSLG